MLAVSFSQLICTLAGQTTRNRRWPLGGQVGDRRERLDGLAEPHLVAEDRAVLVDGVLGAEHLVAAQRHGQQAGSRGTAVICWRSSSGMNPRAASSSSARRRVPTVERTALTDAASVR